MLTLGEKIRTAREKSNMSPQELAKAIGISQPYMSQIENNARTPGRDKLIKIANILKIPLDYLVSSDIYTYDPKRGVGVVEVKDSRDTDRLIEFLKKKNPGLKVIEKSEIAGYMNADHVEKSLVYHAALDKAEKSGLSREQIIAAIEFAIKMKTQAD